MKLRVLEQSFELPPPAKQPIGPPQLVAKTVVEIDGEVYQVVTMIHPDVASRIPTEVFMRKQRFDIMAEIEQRLFGDYNRRDPRLG